MFNVGPTEILVVLLIALIVFGPKRLPEVGRTVGKGLREFRRATQDIRGEIESTLDDDEPAPAPKREETRTAPGPSSVEGNGAGSLGPEAGATQAGDVPRSDGATPVA